jgi:hypothetical protein
LPPLLSWYNPPEEEKVEDDNKEDASSSSPSVSKKGQNRLIIQLAVVFFEGASILMGRLGCNHIIRKRTLYRLALHIYYNPLA